MPCIMCSYCEYIGQGETMEDMWANARRHELEEHLPEMENEYDPEDLKDLKDMYLPKEE